MRRDTFIGEGTRFAPAVMGVLLAALPALGFAESPAAIVRTEVQNVLRILNDASGDATSRRERLTSAIGDRFDLIDMSRSILALSWKDATEAQRDRFVRQFRRLLEHVYISAIEGYTTEKVMVGGESIRGERASVIVTIGRERGPDILLLFKLKRQGEGWIAYDANIEGLSLVRHYREVFEQVARRRGMAGVLEHLDTLVEDSRASIGTLPPGDTAHIEA